MRNNQKLLFRAMFVVLVLVFCISLWQILSKVYEYEKSKHNYEVLTEENVTVLPPPPEESEQEEAPKELAPIAVDFENLKKQNEDVIGWIYCADTPINYPVVQSKDNDYYLRRGLDEKYDIGGSIFMDYRNDAAMTHNNTLIYGHNMMNDTMFGTFVRYKKQSYYDEHPILWYLTPEQNYKIELFAGFVTEPDSRIYDTLEVPEKLAAIIKNALKKSTFQSTVVPEGTERIVTLSTCSYEFDEARYVLLGVLTPVG